MTDAELIAMFREETDRSPIDGFASLSCSTKSARRLFALASRGAAVVEHKDCFERLRREVRAQMTGEDNPHLVKIHVARGHSQLPNGEVGISRTPQEGERFLIWTPDERLPRLIAALQKAMEDTPVSNTGETK